MITGLYTTKKNYANQLCIIPILQCIYGTVYLKPADSHAEAAMSLPCDLQGRSCRPHSPPAWAGRQGRPACLGTHRRQSNIGVSLTHDCRLFQLQKGDVVSPGEGMMKDLSGIDIPF